MRNLIFMWFVMAFCACNAILDNTDLEHVPTSDGTNGGFPAVGGRSGAGAAHGGGRSGDGEAGEAGSGEGGEPGGGAGGTGPEAGGGGPEPVTCDPACSGDTPVCEDKRCVACGRDTHDCRGNTPLTCEDGRWKELEACSGDTPLCAAGSCSRLSLTGQFTTLTTTPSEGPIRLVEQHFDHLPTVCAGNLCLTGRLGP